MTLADLEQQIHDAIEAEDSETLELYAEYSAERLNELGETLCLAVIGADFRAWASVMAVAAQKLPALASALEAIEEHVTRSRAAFIEQLARRRADEIEHNAQQSAELEEVFRRAS